MANPAGSSAMRAIPLGLSSEELRALVEAALKEDLKLLERIWLEKCEPYGENGYNTRLT